MKAKILTIAALAAILSVTSKNIYAATAKSTGYVVLNDIKTISKIEVYGNVELFISTNPAQKVEVYNQYYSESALVQNNKGVLRISSYNPEKLIVWVSVNDLRSVSAYDEAVVNSFGALSNIEFNLDLHNNASAKLNLSAYSADFLLKDSSKLELSGSATNFNINRNFSSLVSDNGFSAQNATDKISVAPLVAKNDELTGLE